MKSAEKAYREANATVTNIRSKLAALKDPLLRLLEQQAQGEREKILAELRKEAGVARVSPESPAQQQADAKTEQKDAAKPEVDKRTALEKSADSLADFQQRLAARNRIYHEREEGMMELVAALGTLAKQATAYANVQSDTRQLTARLLTVDAELKKRVGQGQLPADKVPTAARGLLRGKAQEQLDSGSVLSALAQAEQERQALSQFDLDGKKLKEVMGQLLEVVDAQFDRITDLRKLMADYDRERANRPESETLRLDQLAADRHLSAKTTAERLLGIDPSSAAKSLDELLRAYYRELVEIEEKNDNLNRQKEKVEELVELARKESAGLAQLLPLLQKQQELLRAGAGGGIPPGANAAAAREGERATQGASGEDGPLARQADADCRPREGRACQ